MWGTRVARLVPILGWARQYDRSCLRSDVIAGVTVTALVVPKNLGYAEIARVPIENGLYAAAAGAILYGIFGTSRQISTGPSSALAAVAGSAGARDRHLERTGRRRDRGRDRPRRRADLHPAVRPEDGMDSPVHLPRRHHRVPLRCGDRRHHGRTAEDHRQRREWRQRLAEVLVLAQGTRRYSTEPRCSSGRCRWRSCLGCVLLSPKVPGALVVVIGGLLASAVFNLGDNGVALVGDVPRGLPSLDGPRSPAWWRITRCWCCLPRWRSS